MLRKLAASFLTTAICAVIVVLPCYGAGKHNVTYKYNGHWWLSVTHAEQSGFLNGYYDCYRYEYKGTAKFTINPPEIARDRVTEFYKQNVSHLDDSVATVFYGLRDLLGEKSSARDGQPIRGRHSYYRGLYWMQIYALGGDAGQRGFIEGYLECHVGLNHNRGGSFSKSASEYVSLISHWYRFDPATSDVDTNRQPAPIADVLFKLRDKAHSDNTHDK